MHAKYQLTDILIKHLTEDVGTVTFSLVGNVIEVCVYDPCNLICTLE